MFHYSSVKDCIVNVAPATGQSDPCTAVRDLFEGTPDAGTVVLSCEKDHHMEVHAHLMTNSDGSQTTWRR